MATDTLIIRRLPNKLSVDEKTEFLRQCGAVDVKIISSKVKNYGIAFARFPSIRHAEQALHHLHQQEIMGSYIIAEYARGKQNDVKEDRSDLPKRKKLLETGTEILLKRFFDKLNCWTLGVDFRAPVPSQLRYHYPPPTQTTLQNIVQQLASTPRFYTQVLHLMNKMNLPCPISTDPVVFVPQPTTNIESAPDIPFHSSSSSESELSGDDEIIKETIPEIKPKVKRTLKRPKFLKPRLFQPVTKTKKTTFDEVFEDPKSLTDSLKSKKLKRETPTTIVRETSPPATGFGLIHPLVSATTKVEEKIIDTRNEMEEERLEKNQADYVTLEALASSRIPEKDRELLPVFKNYAEGSPTCRLYVKNLSKQTTEQELRFIFGRFCTDACENSPNLFDIRLMQEGRMKGQAFITLQTVDLAKEALAHTNGFILNDKPMVVQFARSAVK